MALTPLECIQNIICSYSTFFVPYSPTPCKSINVKTVVHNDCPQTMNFSVVFIGFVCTFVITQTPYGYDKFNETSWSAFVRNLVGNWIGWELIGCVQDCWELVVGFKMLQRFWLLWELLIKILNCFGSCCFKNCCFENCCLQILQEFMFSESLAPKCIENFLSPNAPNI